MDIEQIYKILADSQMAVATDTRSIKNGDVFIALKGENFDANEFASKAIVAGASYAIIDNPLYKLNDQYILVANTLETLQQLAVLHRKHLSIPVLAIGGSNGKTTTKELVSNVLSKKYKVHTTLGNLNNNIGVPLTVLKIKPETEIAVIEIGANHAKEHTELMELVSPTHVLVTNNGADHLEGFGSLEGVRMANKEIYDWARINNAHVFVNKEILDLVADSEGIEGTIYPIKEHGSASDLYAGVKYDKTEFRSSLFGSYNEPNILAAIAVGEYFEVPLEEIKEAISGYASTLKRSQYIKGDDYSIVLDCYNANPSSMELSLRDFFNETKNGERVVLIGDMLEMGKDEGILHKKILEFVQSHYDLKDEVICVGPRFTLSKGEFPFKFFDDSINARLYFNALDISKKTVFVKASRGIKIEEVINEKIPF